MSIPLQLIIGLLILIVICVENHWHLDSFNIFSVYLVLANRKSFDTEILFECCANECPAIFIDIAIVQV